MNKKADERLLSIWMFLSWIIIGGGLVWGVALFFSSSVDVRQSEANILNQRIADCLTSDFNISKFDSNFDLFSKCALRKNIIENSDFYYINLTIDSYTGNNILDAYFSGSAVKSPVYNILYGVGYFEADCNYQLNKNKAELNFAQCSFRKIVILDKNQAYEIKILTASNQNDIQK